MDIEALIKTAAGHEAFAVSVIDVEIENLRVKLWAAVRAYDSDLSTHLRDKISDLRAARARLAA